MDITFFHDSIILDADCTINLYASGQIENILRIIPGTVFIADYVLQEEVKWLYDVSMRERKPIELQPFVDNALLTVASLESEAEKITFIDLATTIGDDGESITGAIASHRNWAIGTDDRKAQRVFSVEIPHNQMITTPEFIKYWVDSTHPSISQVHTILQNIRIKAKYEPSTTHQLYEWWHEFNWRHA